MKPLALDTHDFPSIRKAGKIYVDKTMFMYRMITERNARLFFISRPRRFGKSLTVSAFKALFNGRRDLFEGLAIDKADWKWETYPVIHFEFNDLATTSLEEFETSLAHHVERKLTDAGFSYDRNALPSENFGNAITELAAKSRQGRGEDEGGVVILVDEYDAPVGHALDDIEFAEKVRDRLSAVYSQMKNRTGDIRFLFMTGVSKFTKLSVFSALSNLHDVSQRNEYAKMFGYTEEELSANFEEHLREHAAIMGKPYDAYREELKKWYNGFRFSPDDATTVYNPISIAMTLDAKQRSFRATWATTGRPSMLMNYLRREDVLAIDYESVPNVDQSEFDVAELRNLTPKALLFQSGYLTVRDYDDSDDSFTLGVPDEEVRRDLATLVTGVAANEPVAWAASLGKKLLGFRWPEVFDGLKSIYANMPYGAKEGPAHEASFERILCTLLASQGVTYRAESVQSDGRADVIAEHRKGVFIFELKVDEPVKEAFRQIYDKGYAEPYRADPRPVWLIGLSFDRASRRLVDCAAKRASFINNGNPN